MKDNMTVTGIILCAGNSTRFGKGKNKTLCEILGKPVFLFSLKKFLENPHVDDIIISIRPEDRNDIETGLELISNECNKPIKLVPGGSTRQESVYNCIKVSSSDIVVIQDGARPLIMPSFINNCLDEIRFFNGVSIAVKSKDTVKITDNGGVVYSTTNRENTWLTQTPQCFNRNILLKLHEKSIGIFGITDDCMLLEKYKEKVKLIEGNYNNIKITTYEDRYLAEYLLKQ